MKFSETGWRVKRGKERDFVEQIKHYESFLVLYKVYQSCIIMVLQKIQREKKNGKKSVVLT